tara:strand:- start:333 stop:743 length:411 start_codon:yes stop_codon:yes gene_type:complete
MKKTILISFLLLTCSLFYGQGSSNLGFNQVLNYNYSAQFINYDFNSVGSLTVPAGKVWKITSSSTYFKNGNSAWIYATAIKVGDQIVSGNYSANGFYQSNTPLWLSNGTYTVYLLCNDNGADNIYGSISIVEFNIE